MVRRMSPFQWVLSGIAGAFVVAGCGGTMETPSPAPDPTPTTVPTPAPPPGMPEMVVDRVRGDPTTGSGIVVLREKGDGRYLAIGIGPSETLAIAVELEEVEMPRPLTHDLLASVIARLQGRLAHVIITELRANIFYAKLVLTRNGSVLEVDSRPSDAIALALRTDVPVYVDESVLQRAGIVVDELNGESIDGDLN